ncbi:MAG: PAS domain S-box protein [Candidatus Hydrogenedentes bacterium]|nr:PAS domain S-box protein [Candidatus Hydrogenedentota bacterium]
MALWIAVRHARLYRQGSVHPLRLHLSLFACAALLSFVSMGLALSSETIEDHMLFLRWNLATHLAALALFLPLLVQRPRGLTGAMHALTAVLALSCIVLNLLQPFTLRYEYVFGLVQVPLVDGAHYALADGRPNPLAFLYWTAPALFYGCAAMALGDLRRRLHGVDTRWAVLALLVALVCAVFEGFASLRGPFLFPLQETALGALLLAGSVLVRSACQPAGSGSASSEGPAGILLTQLDAVRYSCACSAARTMQRLEGAVAELTGVEAAAMIQDRGVAFASLIHEDERAAVYDEIRRQMEQGADFDVSYRLCLPHGGERWVRDRGRAIYDDAGLAQHIEGVLIDLSREKALETDLQRSDARLHRFLDLTGQGIVRMDIAPPLNITAPPEEQTQHLFEHARVALCNAAFARLHGFASRDAVQGLRLLEIWREPEAQVRGRISRFIKSGYQLDSEEARFVLPTGEPITVLLSFSADLEGNSIVSAWGMQWDITAGTRAVEEAKRLAAVVENSEESVLLCTSSGRVLYMNRSYERMSGLSETEALGRSLHSLTRPDAPDFYMQLDAQRAAGTAWHGAGTCVDGGPVAVSIAPLAVPSLRETIYVVRERLLPG